MLTLDYLRMPTPHYFPPVGHLLLVHPGSSSIRSPFCGSARSLEQAHEHILAPSTVIANLTGIVSAQMTKMLDVDVESAMEAPCLA